MNMREIMNRMNEAVSDNAEAILNEGRDAPLYHGTTFPGLLQILASDTLGNDGNPEYGGGFVCVTRDKQWAHEFVSSHVGVGSVGTAILTLDQTTLSKRYRIRPYAKDWDALDAQARTEEGEDWLGPYERFDEMEERVYGLIKPLSRYLTSIEVNEEYVRSFGTNTIGWATAAARLGGDHAVEAAVEKLLMHPLVRFA
jgi:hypothetical protein